MTLWILGFILVLSALGVIIAKKPVYSALSFLLTLLTLAVLYLQLSAEFIAVMQILVYAGAILVIFMFVIILFQDAYLAIRKKVGLSAFWLLFAGGATLGATLLFWSTKFWGLLQKNHPLPKNFGTVEELGKTLYIDFFFPFEAVIFLFLIAIVGALYIGKRAVR